MSEAYLIDAVRTPGGKRGGGLSGVHPADLGAHVIQELLSRTDLDPLAVEDVFFGCVDAIGPQAGDIARTCWLAAGLPEEVPGTTIDRQCGSSQQALHFAAQAVMSGTSDVIVAGGVQNMSMIPIASSLTAAEPLGFGDPFSGSSGWLARYGDQEVSQFRGAEMIAEKWGISRGDMEQYALESHRRARQAMEEGRFDRELVPIAGVVRDEGPRDTSLAKMASLPPLTEGGRLTAAVSSQITDAASAILVASSEAVKRHGLRPRARVHHLSCRGADPIYMLTAPIPATAYALERSGLSLDDIDLIEINEAFASVVLAWQKETGADLSRVNVNGGAIALGHPLGATGTKLMATLLCELERTGGRYGLQTMCEGGGQANVTIIERLAA
jgi:acetyl-CoA C-acetyltransferase